ncbi:hypothetical protein [Lacunimicrobium album]
MESGDQATTDRKLYQSELEAHRLAIDRLGGNTNATEWLDTKYAVWMIRQLDRLRSRPLPRKMRLYGIACCRLITNLKRSAIWLRALDVAERMTDAKAAGQEQRETLSRLRSRKQQIEKWQSRFQREKYLFKIWTYQAIINLFQDDEDYLKENDDTWLSLNDVQKDVSYATTGLEIGFFEQQALLWEIFGQPFLSTEFDSNWRTSEVVDLAETMYRTQDFSQIGILGNLLQDAGCGDPRILTHCQRRQGHVRGCWLIDEILGNPIIDSSEIKWSFHCSHPHVDAEELKQQYRYFGTLGTKDRRCDTDVMSFADWLEENGDVHWANCVRVRCISDHVSPSVDYVDQLELLRESNSQIGRPRSGSMLSIDGMYFGGYDFADENWWQGETQEYQRGLPTLINAVIPGNDPRPADVLIQQLQGVVQNTPIRGVDFEEHYANDMYEILSSPPGRELTSIKYDYRNFGRSLACPVLTAIASTPPARCLEFLSINEGIITDQDAMVLATAPFDRLYRLDMPYGGIKCSSAAAERLVTSPWFKQLGQLFCTFGDECAEVVVRHLGQMPKLHSLAQSRTPRSGLIAMRYGNFSQLRRLAMIETNFGEETATILCELRAPNLLSLTLKGCLLEKRELLKVLGSSLLDNVQVLELEQSLLDEECLKQLTDTACILNLKMLRLNCSDSDLNGRFQSLASSAFVTTSAFRGLRSLAISYPFANNVKRDTGEFLERLNMPNLRSLELEGCDFNDQCAHALMTNPNLPQLRRLKLKKGFQSNVQVAYPLVVKMMESSNLKNLVECDLDGIY